MKDSPLSISLTFAHAPPLTSTIKPSFASVPVAEITSPPVNSTSFVALSAAVSFTVPSVNVEPSAVAAIVNVAFSAAYESPLITYVSELFSPLVISASKSTVNVVTASFI